MVAEPLEPERGDHLVHASSLRRSARRAQGSRSVVDEHRHLGPGVLAEQEHVEHGELRVEPAVLERAHHADAEPLLGQVLAQVHAVDPDAARPEGRPDPRSRRASWSSPSRWPR